MAINEIEVKGSSATFRCFKANVEDMEVMINNINKDGDMFSIDDELPGFHDFDMENDLIRGFYSGIIPFEVEHIVDGIMTKTLFKRIESCEFFLTPRMMFCLGSTSVMNAVSHAISSLSGFNTVKLELDFKHLHLFQERMTIVKSITVQNPKDKELRTVRMAGHIESYDEYNVLDARNHGIKSVNGIIDTPIGPSNVSLSDSGVLRISVKKGMIILVDHLEWILRLALEYKRPPVVYPDGKQQSEFSYETGDCKINETK